MEEQSGREFALANPPAGAQDATLQERRLSPEIPFNPYSRLQHFQRPTPSHVSPNEPRASRCSDEHVAERGRSGLTIPETTTLRVVARQRDRASARRPQKRRGGLLGRRTEVPRRESMYCGHTRPRPWTTNARSNAPATAQSAGALVGLKSKKSGSTGRGPADPLAVVGCLRSIVALGGWGARKPSSRKPILRGKSSK
jgi:hypothetical protein